MPTRRNTEPALDKRISFQSQVIIRRYSQDLPVSFLVDRNGVLKV